MIKCENPFLLIKCAKDSHILSPKNNSVFAYVHVVGINLTNCLDVKLKKF